MGEKVNLSRSSIAWIGFVFIGLFLISMSNVGIGQLQSSPSVVNGGVLTERSEVLAIDGDADFSPFSGNGSALNPYIIEGLSFTDTPLRCITIYHTTKYFILRQCIFFNVSEAIELYNVTYGCLLRNEVRNSTVGISIRFSSHIKTENNTVLFGLLGLDLLYSENCIVVGNNLSYSEEGISLFDADNNTISGNIITHDLIGIDLSLSDNNTFYGNTFQCNSGYNWHESECFGNRFEGNILKSCGPESSLDLYLIVIGVVAGGAGVIIGVRVLYHRRTLSTVSSKKSKKAKGYL